MVDEHQLKKRAGRGGRGLIEIERDLVENLKQQTRH